MKRFFKLLALTATFLMFSALLSSCSQSASCQHQWSEWTTEKVASCLDGGYDTRYCTLCPATDRRVYDAKGHSYSSEWSYDGTAHWHDAVCDHVGERGSYGAHTFDAAGKYCTVCKIQRVTQGLQYKGNIADGTYTVSGIGNALDSDVIVGSTYNGDPILGIEAEAFSSCVGLSSVYMGDNIIYIGDRAFAGSRDLVEVTFAYTLEYLGKDVFSGCDDLQVVYFFGTQEQWNAIPKDSSWKSEDSNFIVRSALDNSVINTDCEHSWSEWQVAKEGSCLDGGYSERICENCTAFERVETHTYSDVWSNDSQYHWHAASCGHDVITDKQQHEFVDNACTVCGIERATQGLEYRGLLGKNSYYVSGIGNSLEANVVIGYTYSSDNVPIVGIGEEAFSDCDGLLSVYAFENITFIGDRAFADSKDLNLVQFSSSVETLGEGVFSGCTSLAGIIYVGTSEQWNELVSNSAGWNDGISSRCQIYCALDNTYVTP